MASALFNHIYGLSPREFKELELDEYFGLLYNIPMVVNLRLLEAAAGIGLLFAPEKVTELSAQLGTEIPTARSVPGLRDILG